jgi:acetylornithine deacetylase
MLPGEKIPEVLEHYRSLIDKSLDVSFDTPMLEDEALETSRVTDLVRTALSVAQQLKMDATPIGVPFGTDASKFSRAGIPSIICGPGSIDLAHGAVEYLEIEQLQWAVEFYRGLMLAFV